MQLVALMDLPNKDWDFSRQVLQSPHSQDCSPGLSEPNEDWIA